MTRGGTVERFVPWIFVVHVRDDIAIPVARLDDAFFKCRTDESGRAVLQDEDGDEPLMCLGIYSRKIKD